MAIVLEVVPEFQYTVFDGRSGYPYVYMQVYTDIK